MKTARATGKRWKLQLADMYAEDWLERFVDEGRGTERNFKVLGERRRDRTVIVELDEHALRDLYADATHYGITESSRYWSGCRWLVAGARGALKKIQRAAPELQLGDLSVRLDDDPLPNYTQLVIEK